jgi:putative FmdB family regulatory protein
MPLYEYACDSCGAEMEVLQRLSDAPLSTHEGCGGALRKLMSSPRTRVKENDGMTGSTHSSILRFHENTKIAAEKKKGRA